ncbi:MAG: hypothetical protein K6A36_06430 [Paludibacteraceae bacterium]|nr:hypothetical protein [Paludibacteraceae bacterium]
MKTKFTLLAVVAMLLISCGLQKPLTDEQYAKAIRNDMPFRVAELTLLKPDIYTFSCDGYVDLLPDYEVNEEGDMVVWRTSFVSMRQRQSPQVIWRDVVISKRHQRVLCIDRLLRDDKTFGYVYVLQGETKACPKGYHWDVADHRLMLSVAAIFRDMTDMSLEQLRVNNAADNQ